MNGFTASYGAPVYLIGKYGDLSVRQCEYDTPRTIYKSPLPRTTERFAALQLRTVQPWVV